jgi:hypothetical protein
MKKITLGIFICLIIVLRAFGQTDTIKSSEYKNATYRFSLKVPGNWKLYGEIPDDKIKHQAIADWGLPPIFSDLEKTDIENSVSITAYKKANIKSVHQLISMEAARTNPATNIMKQDSTSENARIIFRTDRGLKYKGKSYFIFKNDIGYVINFMATPGTYAKNLPAFEAFYKNVKFD